ncbi:TPA: hypothetical protein L4Q87_000432 [Pseudomonas aeruginosa]|uniref:Uncharacterized protein n=3 Tax=Pseudomonadales TaxID=72274 RepID=A0ACC5VPK6_STUCH|nr:hypothetical protein APA58_11325 [Pseudomonas aeruginosa]MBX7274291.1 hypothetical protein [Stutzerimonas chloritidismutans]KSM84332.1 hypothetical protein APA73_11380 [Pseudomonas aeruginosa]MBG6888230.1 hypothetical protein [Pseudomonas aeruginosa]MBV5858627.1 hypothetical protein [Pseudomonas aeruginosa]
MPLPYDILRLFTSPQGYLVEIQQAAPAAAREWLWVTDCSVTSLRALNTESDTPQVRHFREAQLQLDGIRAQLVWPNGDCQALMACSMPALPAAQHQLIHNHLS